MQGYRRLKRDNEVRLPEEETELNLVQTKKCVKVTNTAL